VKPHYSIGWRLSKKAVPGIVIEIKRVMSYYLYPPGCATPLGKGGEGDLFSGSISLFSAGLSLLFRIESAKIDTYGKVQDPFA
jgi:hypothetical protein